MCFSLNIKVKSKWSRDLDIKAGILKLLEDDIGTIFEATGTGKGFLKIIPIAQERIQRINKQEYNKLKIFCTANVSTDCRHSLQNGKKWPATFLRENYI